MGHSVTIPIISPLVDLQLDNGRGEVVRISLREPTGTASASVEFFDGSGIGGILTDPINLTPGQSTRDVYRKMEWPYYGGLFLHIVSGTVRGAVTVKHSDDWDHEGEHVIIVGKTIDLYEVGLTP